MTTDTSERGLERLICTALTGSPCDPGAVPANEVQEQPGADGTGWIGGSPEDYDREYCVDLVQLSAFLRKSSYVAVLKDINLSIPLRKVPATFTPPLFDDRFSTEAS